MEGEGIIDAINAVRGESKLIESETLMRALLDKYDGSLQKIFTKAGIDFKSVLQDTDTFINQRIKADEPDLPKIGLHLEFLLRRATKYKKKFGDEYMSVGHLLIAFCSDERFGKRLFGNIQKSKKDLKDAVKAIHGAERYPAQKLVALAKYGSDLTELARLSKLDPVIGREAEIELCIDILLCRTKNNPMIIGEPGVGKTAIVQGLAQRIVRGKVPTPLLNRKVISLDMGSIISGTSYRGEFEAKLKDILKEVTASKGRIILFIDEIHMIVGAGSTSEDSMDVANLLKPMLARGELRCIGATTLNEHRQYIEKDVALVRRFTQVFCEQPSMEQTISILHGLRKWYELQYGINISNSALDAAVMLADRYITDKFMPDKAIGLIDQAAATVKKRFDYRPIELDKIDRDIVELGNERLSTNTASEEWSRKLDNDLNSFKRRKIDLTEQWQRETALKTQIASIKEEIEGVNFEISTAERQYDLIRAFKLKYKTLVSLQTKLEAAEKSCADLWGSGNLLLREVVTHDDVSEIVSKRTGIPLLSLQQSEKDKLLSLEELLHKRVIGQHVAIRSVVAAIRRSRLGLSNPKGPIASFMFMGPTGVGKTELVKALADYLFNTEKALVRLDMSEYKELHSISRLLGAPPSYGGRGGSGQLTEVVRRRPYSVVLLDEIEKAHDAVFDVLLNLLGDGRITDSEGRTVDFRNCIVIMTSNIGSHEIIETLQNTAGSKDEVYAKIQRQVKELAGKTFRPELINRIGECIVFPPLDLDEIIKITQIQLNELKDRVKQQRKMDLQYTEEAVRVLSTLGFDHKSGARLVMRVIEEKVVDDIVSGVLLGDFKEEDSILIDAASPEELPLEKRLVIRKLG